MSELPKNPYPKRDENNYGDVLDVPTLLEGARLAYDQAQQDMLEAGYRLPDIEPSIREE